jgi:hypothetical protein
MASFRGGGTTPLMVRDCPVLALGEGIFSVGCQVRTGESGAPILVDGPEGPAIVGIVSRRMKLDGDHRAIGPTLEHLQGIATPASAP